MTTNKKTLLFYILEAIFFIIIIACIWRYYDNKLSISDQNLKTAVGRMEYVEMKNGELLVYNNLYVAAINDLEELLNISKKETKEIQRELDSKIAYISKLESNVRIEYIETVRDSIIYINSDSQVATSTFRYSDKWVDLVGRNDFTFGKEFNYNTTIESLSMNVPLNVGLTNDYQIFVKTPNPYISFTNIEGAVIDNSILRPKKKRFSWGLHGGVGVMYDVIDKDIAIGPNASFGVHINF